VGGPSPGPCFSFLGFIGSTRRTGFLIVTTNHPPFRLPFLFSLSVICDFMFLCAKWLSESYYKNRAMNDRAQVKFQGPKYILSLKGKNGILFGSQQEENDYF